MKFISVLVITQKSTFFLDSWKDNDLRVALIGKEVDLSYDYEVRLLLFRSKSDKNILKCETGD